MGHKLIPYEFVISKIESNVSTFKMWPWELKPQKLNTLDNWMCQGQHLFAALYCIYKTSFWGTEIHIGPKHPVYLKGFLVKFLNLPTHLQEMFLEKLWNKIKS